LKQTAIISIRADSETERNTSLSEQAILRLNVVVQPETLKFLIPVARHSPPSQSLQRSLMATIRPLPESVRSSIRSGISLFDFTRIVEELVFNSLDARATKVSLIP
jgi:hypothetical protein